MQFLIKEFTSNFKGPDTNLDCLKIIGIGGSPVKKENFEYLRNNVKKDVFIGSMYGKFFIKIFNREIQIRVLRLHLRDIGKKNCATIFCNHLENIVL